LTCAFVGTIALHKPAVTSEEIEKKAFIGPYSDIPAPRFILRGLRPAVYPPAR
jgi:hypothetical protein